MKNWFVFILTMTAMGIVPPVVPAAQAQNRNYGDNETSNIKEQLSAIQTRLNEMHESINSLREELKEMRNKDAEEHQQIRVWIRRQ